MTPRPAAPELTRGGPAPAEAGRARHPPARGRPGTAHLRRLGRAAAYRRTHARRGLREHPAHLLPVARRHHGPDCSPIGTGPGRQVRRHEKSIETFYIPPRPAPQTAARTMAGMATTSHRRPGGTPTGSPTSGTCRRPTGQPLTVPAGLPPPRPGPRGPVGRAVLAGPPRRIHRRASRRRAKPTAPPSGPSAASGSCQA